MESNINLEWNALVDLHFKKITWAALLSINYKDIQEEVSALAVIQWMSLVGWMRVLVATEIKSTHILDIFWRWPIRLADGFYMGVRERKKKEELSLTPRTWTWATRRRRFIYWEWGRADVWRKSGQELHFRHGKLEIKCAAWDTRLKFRGEFWAGNVNLGYKPWD